MEQLLQQIEAIKAEIAATEATTPDAVEQYRIKYLGTKGLVKQIMGEMKNVPNEQKKEFGQILNAFKIVAEEKMAQLQEALGDSGEQGSANFDFTLPGDPVAVGTRHPLNLVRNQMVSIFKRLGFAVAEGPEVEDDWHNFGAMNLPADHPARDMQDTFYVQEASENNAAWLLRTHTSSVQARVMETQKREKRHKLYGSGSVKCFLMQFGLRLTSWVVTRMQHFTDISTVSPLLLWKSRHSM